MAEPVADEMTGAEAIIGSLADCGVTACFANPGTSEMHLVTALDKEPRIRPVLCLFEGVATGAADGFARMAGRPALTLLHLGPGYLNGGANIHNAKRAYSPMINLVGDHAVTHRGLDAPLASDIEGMAGPNSRWMRSVDRVQDAGRRAAEAYAASFGPPPGPVTLIMPADTAWTKGAARAGALAHAGLKHVPDGMVDSAARSVGKAKQPAVLVNGTALTEQGLDVMARLQAAGVKVISDTFMARQARGGGRFAPERLPYFAEAAIEMLRQVDLLVTVGTKAPVAFFAYPNMPGRLYPDRGDIITLGGPDTDSAATLNRLADALGAKAPEAGKEAWKRADVVGGDKFNPFSIGQSLAALLPEGTVISDDGVTSGLAVYQAMATAAPHEWLGHTGGAIGQGMPMATGAAVAAPDRKVVCLAGDGAGMYTVQALWTQARENLDVLTIVFANGSYKILQVELQRTGAGAAGPAAAKLLELGGPDLDWVKISEGLGVGAEWADTQDRFNDALKRALAQKGPRLIACKVA